jgi:DNA-binding Lrp family transcriptional regulator
MYGCFVAKTPTSFTTERDEIVTGSTDLLVRARVADLRDLRQLLVEHIWPITGIQRV